MAKQEILIIVVTRADIPRGRGDDEFTEDWGQNKEKNFFGLDDFSIDGGDIYFLVLHGCKENKKSDYPKFFQNAMKEKGDGFLNKIGKIYLGYHGIDLKDLQPLKDNIKTKFNRDRLQEPFSYSSRDGVHNLAIFDLLNQLENEYKLTGIHEHVLSTLKGRLPFVHQLHCLQSELLRLHFCIATIVSASNDLKQSAIENAKDAVSKFTEIIQREGFNTYYQEKIKLQIKVKKNIEALLDIFRTIDSNQWDSWVKDNLQEGVFWGKCLDPIAYNHLSPNQLPSLERDFRILACAVDYLLDAASISCEP